MLEATVALAVLAVLMTVSLALLATARDHRALNRDMLALRADLAARAEDLRAADYRDLAASAPESVETLQLADRTCRLTTRVAQADPARPGLLRITLVAELLTGDGRTLRRTEIELLRADTQWTE